MGQQRVQRVRDLAGGVTSAGKSVAANPTKSTVDDGVASAKAATTTLKTTLQGL